MSRPLFRIYREEDGPEGGAGWLGKLTAYLADRPGSLAELAGVFARFGANIVFFHYNRSEHPNRVVVEVEARGPGALREAAAALRERALLCPVSPGMELGVLDTGNILSIEVRLENRPGTLGRFASLLSEHGANVIHMSYDEAVSETSARFSLVTGDPGEIDRLLREMNSRGYYYSIHYRGAGRREVEDVIGLNLAERFFFRLKDLLRTGDIGRLKRLVESSRRLTAALQSFSREAGKHFGEGDVITRVLAFASASLTKTGEGFSFRRLPPLARGGVTLHAFRLPTGGNLLVLEAGGEAVMVDGGYGLYFDDAMGMLRASGIEPSRIGRVYLTHADADHAGMSGRCARELGSRVFMHPACRGVVENENRAFGSGTPLLELNHHFTVLVNEFTGCGFPERWDDYGGGGGEAGGFRVLGGFTLAGRAFEVLESLGGHVPGQVFIMSRGLGLLFTGDYLLDVESLEPGEREILSYPRFMMTSTNVDSALFRREMDMLGALAVGLDGEARERGLEAVVVPGHGDYYPARRLA